MSTVFAGKYRESLTRSYRAGALEFHGACAPYADPNAFYALLRKTKANAWNIYAKRPFAGPQQVFDYLGKKGQPAQCVIFLLTQFVEVVCCAHAKISSS